MITVPEEIYHRKARRNMNGNISGKHINLKLRLEPKPEDCTIAVFSQV